MKRVTNLSLFCSTLLFLLVGLVSSNLDQDRAECAEQLIGLASCLPYVGGDAKVPTLDCCTGLKQVLSKSKKCLCILIKDRNDPSLGLKINATLAMRLPSACHAPVNISNCVDLLHLAPSSPDAKVFEEFDKSLSAQANTTTAIPVASGSSNSKGTSAEVKSDGGRGRKWVVSEMVCEILPLIFTSHLIFSMYEGTF
ncbi:Lipid transfer protein [Quillaja saponaria]|uniref:Lipid transfer protein n=1 Tax=Quillaja saponaria TaxID=32244 RepID=A0AAD7LC53_QUISA|nr:Lipid transfer protein [Quillaja saponaria]